MDPQAGRLLDQPKEALARGVLEAAMDAMLYCSNGTLCDSSRFAPGRHSGAACYACTVLPETSCEHRNLWLDRNVLLEGPP